MADLNPQPLPPRSERVRIYAKRAQLADLRRKRNYTGLFTGILEGSA